MTAANADLPVPTISGNRLSDGYLIETPPLCRSCHRPCVGIATAELGFCPFGYGIIRLRENLFAVGLVVLGRSLPSQAVKLQRNKGIRKSAIAEQHVRHFIASFREREASNARRAQTQHVEKLIAEAEEVGIAEVIKQLGPAVTETVGYLHDYRAPALQILQNCEALLGIDHDDHLHVRGRLEGKNNNLVAIYWTSRILQSKLDGIRYILDPDRIWEGSNEVQRLHGLLHKLVQIFKSSCEFRDIDLRLMGESYSLAEAPRQVLEQAVLPLLDNAVKYAPKGSQITVNIEEVGSSFELAVTSLGPAIQLQPIEAIFQPLVRGVHADVREEGMGIGLAIHRLCCERLNATSRVEQTHSTGQYRETKFTMTIPIAEKRSGNPKWP